MYDDIEGIIARRFGKIRKSKGKNGVDYIVKCFSCAKPKLYINPEHDMYHCFRCGKTGSVGSLIGQRLQAKEKADEPRILQPLPEHIKAPGLLTELTMLADDHPAISYIRNRRYDVKELNDVFGVRYCYEGRVFGGIFNTTNTLIFPLWMSGKVAGWQARLLYTPADLTDDECELVGLVKDEDGDWLKPPKYFTSPGVEKGRIFFNFDVARLSEVVVITEGPFDAISVGRPAVATLGKGVTEQQAIIIKSYWKVAVILLDPGDADAEMATLELQLKISMPTIKVTLRGYKDPGEAPRDDIWAQIGETAFNMGVDLLKYKIVL